MFTCASCTIEACRSGQLDKMPKNCPMRDRAFFDSILEEYFKPENHDFSSPAPPPRPSATAAGPACGR